MNRTTNICIRLRPRERVQILEAARRLEERPTDLIRRAVLLEAGRILTEVAAPAGDRGPGGA
jgi:hypothetical protein